MQLEFAIDTAVQGTYPFSISEGETHVIDWEPMVLQIMQDVEDELATGIISAKFHNTLSEIIVSVAQLIGVPKVVLTGGCFQNKYLTEHAVARLRAEGFEPYWHQRIPPNDGGIAPGQLAAAAMMKQQVTTQRKKIIAV